MTTHAEVPKTMIAVKASLNGNIFMRCPTEDMNDDFQVGVFPLPLEFCEIREVYELGTYSSRRQVEQKRESSELQSGNIQK